jgi:hypothetical protein
MRLKTAGVALVFSLVFIVSHASYADTLTFQSGSTDPAPIGYYGYGTFNDQGQQINQDQYVYPFYFTYTGPGGTNPLVGLSCMNYDRDIDWGQSWNVTPLLVSGVTPTESIDNGAFTGAQVLDDAYLFNEYAGAAGDDLLLSEIQYAIWSIMDPTDIFPTSYQSDFLGGYDATSQLLAQQAIANASSEPSGYYGNDVAFVPSDSYPNGGEPQILMANPIPPAVAPEPTSLVLLGTGLLGTVAFMRRKHGKA